MALTILLVERVLSFVKKRNEQLFRNLLLRTCRMPIHAYFSYWLMIFKEQLGRPAGERIALYDNLQDFLLSDDFFNAVRQFNFNRRIGEDKTYAQYFYDKMNEVADKFQNMLSKYGSKLTYNDVKLFEHFGGGAFMYTVFMVMKFLSEATFTIQEDDEEEVPLVPHINSINNIRRDHFNEHFTKFVELVNEYNAAVDNEYQRWTLQSLMTLGTIEAANNNPAIDW